jgi:hypothetical protein
MKQKIQTIYHVGVSTYNNAKEFTLFANKLKLFNSTNWRIPTWEEARLIVSTFSDLNPTEINEFWTDNKSSIRKINCIDGSYFECNKKEHLDESINFFIVNDALIDTTQNLNIEINDLNGIILPFEGLNYGEVDQLNQLLGHFYMTDNLSFRRPTIEELKIIADSTLENIEGGDYWSSSEGGKYNAFVMNLITKEIYACKKSSDYTERKAKSIAVFS